MSGRVIYLTINHWLSQFVMTLRGEKKVSHGGFSK
jgi:hypothetical protein